MKFRQYASQVKALSRQVTKSATKGERILGALFPNRGTGFPGGWSQNRLEQVQHLRNWTYVFINCICSKIASLMPNLAMVHDQPIAGKTTKACQRGLMNATHGTWGGSSSISMGGHSFLTMGEYRSKALSAVKPHEELEPLELNHELRRLVENPNPVDTSYDFFYEKKMFDLLCGVSYVWLVPNVYGKPCEMWVIPSHWVWPRTGGGRLMDREYFPGGVSHAPKGAYVRPDDPYADRLIHYYEIRPWGGMGSSGVLWLPPDEVIMFRRKSPLNKIDGYSPLEAVAQWIDSEESISASRWSQFQNQARPELAITLGPGYEDPTDPRIKRLEAKLAYKLQGEYNYGKPFVVPPGAKVEPLSFNPTEMAYFQSEEQIRDMLGSAFQVPKTAVGISSDMTYGSVLATLAQLCHDERTECLTAEGWKRHDELTPETRVACYDEPTGTLVYRKPSRVVRQHYRGPMHRWQGEKVDALLTPAHRVYVKRRSARPHVDKKLGWGVKRVEELTPATTYMVLRAAPAACDEPVPAVVEKFTGYRQHEVSAPYSIDPHVWLRFLGHYISEGHLVTRKPGARRGWEVGVTQSKASPHLPAIEAGLAATPFQWSRRDSVNNCYQWCVSDRGLYEHLLRHCGDGAESKRVPDYVKAWPAEDLRVLLDALIDGDGADPQTVENTGVWWTAYGTSSRQLADDVMEVATKCGLGAFITVVEETRNGQPGQPNRQPERYVVNISSRTASCLCPAQRTVERYDGVVWCLEVPTGLFVVRRNGRAHVSGNCSGCLNPQLAADGQSFTKYLASRWDEPAGPAWGHGVTLPPPHNSLEAQEVGPGDAAEVDEVGTPNYLPATQFSPEDNDRKLGDAGRGGMEVYDNTLLPPADEATGWPPRPIRPQVSWGKEVTSYDKSYKLLHDVYDEGVVRWDNWFAAVGGDSEKCWGVVKSQGFSPREMDAWGTIIEMNRLNEVTEHETFVRKAVTMGQGGRGASPARCKLWWDDCVPADPAQVNADLAEDRASQAITPCEVRALRGRKPYPHGGDDPVVTAGPNGIMVIPWNTGQKQDKLAELMKPLAGGDEQGGPGGMPGAGGNALGGAAPPNPLANDKGGPDRVGGGVNQFDPDVGLGKPKVENPNGAPSKNVCYYGVKAVREEVVKAGQTK